MKKYEIIKKNSDFNDIINSGSLLKNKYYSVYYVKSEEDYPKFGLAVSKKFGNAVERNKIKRQLRSIIDNNKDRFKANNYIIMVRKCLKEVSFQVKEEKFLEIMVRKGDINEEK